MPSISGFSFIESDEADSSEPYFGYRSTPYKTRPFTRRSGARSTPTLSYPSNSPVPTAFPSVYTPTFNFRSLLPKIWDVLSSPTRQSVGLVSPAKKGKAKQEPDWIWSEEETVDYSTLAPLDDDEGEFIDDEACFVTVDFWGIDVGDRIGRARRVTGIGKRIIIP